MVAAIEVRGTVRTKMDPLATAIALISLGIAFAALLISWQAKQIQRADHKLNRQAAEEKGRLREVEGLHRNKRKGAGIGFRILNGPDEVTVRRAVISMRYTVNRPGAVWRDDVEFKLDVQSDEFGVLGITGKELGFRLLPLHDEEWRFPLSASWYLPNLPAEKEGGEDRYQQIEFTFSVTSSGHTLSSLPELLLGGWDNRRLPFGYRDQRPKSKSSLQVIILATLAKDAIRSIQSTSTTVHAPSLEALARRGPDMPAGLQKWLVDAWEQSGSFDETQIEKLARTFVRLRPPHPDPRLLAIWIQAESHNQLPATPADLADLDL
jgi:hypothetical protein